MWHIGQKIVCITDAWVDSKSRNACLGETGPKKDHIYSIRDILTFPDMPDRIFFHLFEIRNRPWYIKPDGQLIEASFCSEGFRPLDEEKKETDISIFKTILDKLPGKVLADA